MKARLVDYFDVWGNKKDGWLINDFTNIGTIDCPSFERSDMLKSLKNVDYFQKHVRLNMLEIEDLYPYYEISRKKDGRPLCQLEIIED